MKNILPRVTIILLNWNGRELLDSSLPPLLDLDYPDFRVVVVDNASTDGSVAYLGQNYPQVTIVENEYNAGFAAGNNVVLRNLVSEVAVLVNPDVIVDRGWLRALISGLTSDASIGIAGCKLFHPGRERLQHAGGVIDFPRALPRYVGLNEQDRGQYDELRNVDYVVGAAMAIKRDVLDEVGLLDEGFFLYFEDVDLCRRAQRAGYRVVYVPDAVAVHAESTLTVKHSPSYLQHFHTSRWRYILKHYLPQDILSETRVAEEEWLARTVRQPIVTRAYHHSLRHFHSIMAARQHDGESPPNDAQQRAIISLLEQLQQAAWDTGSLDELRQHADIREKPFRSSVPLLGGMIAGFRDAWNRVATRDYVRSLLTQQRYFNRLLVDTFVSQQEEMSDHDKRAGRMAAELSSTRQAMWELQEAISDAEARVGRLEDLLLGPGAEDNAG